jgi:uncharacterized protein (DUF2384 family)
LVGIEVRHGHTTGEYANGRAPPSRFITLSVHAGEVFANQEKALDWLRSPNPSLAGRTPLEAAATEEGFSRPRTCLPASSTVFAADAGVSVVP